LGRREGAKGDFGRGTNQENQDLKDAARQAEDRGGGRFRESHAAGKKRGKIKYAREMEIISLRGGKSKRCGQHWTCAEKGKITGVVQGSKDETKHAIIKAIFEGAKCRKRPNASWADPMQKLLDNTTTKTVRLPQTRGS